eukprot:2391128-Prymnesium_polylepis.1
MRRTLLSRCTARVPAPSTEHIGRGIERELVEARRERLGRLRAPCRVLAALLEHIVGARWPPMQLDARRLESAAGSGRERGVRVEQHIAKGNKVLLRHTVASEDYGPIEQW